MHIFLANYSNWQCTHRAKCLFTHSLVFQNDQLIENSVSVTKKGFEISCHICCICAVRPDSGTVISFHRVILTHMLWYVKRVTLRCFGGFLSHHLELSWTTCRQIIRSLIITSVVRSAGWKAFKFQNGLGLIHLKLASVSSFSFRSFYLKWTRQFSLWNELRPSSHFNLGTVRKLLGEHLSVL